MKNQKDKEKWQDVDNKRRKSAYENQFKMPKHGCTDIFCTILFLIFIAVFVAVSVFAYINGKPEEIVLPHDSYGNICGKSKNFENKKYLLFYDITECLSFFTTLSCPTKQVCVEKCPNQTLYNKISSHVELLKQYCDNTSCPNYVIQSENILGRCVPSILKKFTDSLVNLSVTAFDPQQNQNITIESINEGPLTLGLLEKGSKYISKLLDIERLFQLVYQDIGNSYPYMLVIIAIGTVISLIWLFILRFIVKPIVYFSILVVFGLLGFATYFCVQEYLSLSNTSTQFKFTTDLKYYGNLKETWLGLSIISGLVLLIFLLVVFFLRKRITFAANIIKEVSKAVISLPASFIWPIFPFIFLVIVLVYCCSVSLFLASSGVQLFRIVDTSNETNKTFISTTTVQTFQYNLNKQEGIKQPRFAVGDYCKPEEFYKFKLTNTSLKYLECFYYEFGYPTQLKDLDIDIDSETVQKYYTVVIEFLNKYQYIPQIYVAFMLFWFLAFITGLNQMTLAGSFGIWYWTPFKNEKRTKKRSLPFFTLILSFSRAIFYHFGTLAFGSLLIAIIKIIRLILEVISNKAKSNADTSKIAKYVICCCKCCFWCLERFIKFLNRYSYIITAIYSKNFLMAAAKAFKLITGNVLRVAVTDRISNAILFMSNLAITTLIGVFSFYFFTNKIPLEVFKSLTPELNYYVVPLVIVILATYVVTKICFDVFAIGIDTVLMCILIDLDLNDGSPQKPYFMSKELHNLVGKRKNY